MRYGVVSDIHGNLHALRAAVATLERRGVDGWLCSGDIVGYGPSPNECIETLTGLGAVCVAGNHDLMALGRLPGDHAGPLARRSTDWTRSQLSEGSIAALDALPLSIDLGDVVVSHGSLDDPQRYVHSDRDARRELDRLSARVARFLVLGHTHRPWVYRAQRGTIPLPTGGPATIPPGDRVLVNPGSVGQSRQREPRPLARFALIDTGDRSVELFAVRYDVEGCLEALTRHGLPPASIHLEPRLPRVWSQQARRWWRGGPA
jgi:predicted phosphodiesterase